MATLPNSRETARDGGLNLTELASMTPVVIGGCSGGTANTLEFYADANAMHDANGEGPGVLAVDHIAAYGGGPVGFIKCATSVAAVLSAVTASSGATSTVTVTGTPNYDTTYRVEILKSGALGTATFRYTLDSYSGDTAAKRTYSETLIVPAGGTFAVPNHGFNFVFTGAATLGDYYTGTTTAAAMNVSDLNTAFAALVSDARKWRFVYAVTSGVVTSTGAALLAVALQSQLDSIATASVYRAGIVSASGTTAALAYTAFAASSSTLRVMVPFGKVRRTAVKTTPGFGLPTTEAADCFAARAARSLPSTDLKRKLDGNLSEVAVCFHDERAAPSGLDDIKISTLRTYGGSANIYITQGRIRSPSGSDYKLWPHRLIMDIACETVHEVLETQIGRGLRTKTATVADVEYPGAIDPRDAAPIEALVNSALAARLAQPLNAEGNAGFVNGVRYSISKTANFLATGIISGAVSISPLGSVEGSDTQLGFVVALPEEA